MRITSTCTVSTVVLNEELCLGNDGISIARNVDAGLCMLCAFWVFPCVKKSPLCFFVKRVIFFFKLVWHPKLVTTPWHTNKTGRGSLILRWLFIFGSSYLSNCSLFPSRLKLNLNNIQPLSFCKGKDPDKICGNFNL